MTARCRCRPTPAGQCSSVTAEPSKAACVHGNDLAPARPPTLALPARALEVPGGWLPRRLRRIPRSMKYLDKSFSIIGPDMRFWDAYFAPKRISKGEWVLLPNGRQRWIP